MDAKAKVVAWELRYLPPVGDWSRWMPSSQYAYDNMLHYEHALETEYRELIPLTDHEAALAELAERHAATERNACLMAELANEEKRKRQDLLSGMGALAGELREDMETFKGGVEGSWYRWRYDTLAVMEERIRTLASAGLEGKESD